jgi:two-component sensor histidine kinase
VPANKQISVSVQDSPVSVTPTQANSLALIINELTTNTVKYALRQHNRTDINVGIEQCGEMIQFEFRNDGPGYPEGVLRLEAHNTGIDLVRALVRDGLRGELSLDNEDGPVTSIRFRAA